MFGREARIPLNTMFQFQIRYLGNDEKLVAENLQKARKRMAPANFPQATILKTEDSVMIKITLQVLLNQYIKEIIAWLLFKEIRLVVYITIT